MNAGWYFQSSEEANEWLDFESVSYEREMAFYAENDRYTEWQKWREDWLLNDKSPA